YSSKKAQKVYLERRKESKEKSRIIENNFEIEEKITNLITKKQLSPDQISGRYKTVCHQTIYNWIYRMFDYKNRGFTSVTHLCNPYIKNRGFTSQAHLSGCKNRGFTSVTLTSVTLRVN
ncbi:hypothetical protein KKG37_01290, partial [Patescibacteria group bacterium]|nr:hypothetical protein [Patescibacteria group bacterium]